MSLREDLARLGERISDLRAAIGNHVANHPTADTSGVQAALEKVDQAAVAVSAHGEVSVPDQAVSGDESVAATSSTTQEPDSDDAGADENPPAEGEQTGAATPSTSEVAVEAEPATA